MTRRLLLLFVSALLAAPSFAEQFGPDGKAAPKVPKIRRDWASRFQDSRHGPEVTERFNRSVRIGRTGSFELTNVSGNVIVTGGSGDEVRIEAIKRARSRDESAAKTLLDELRIDVIELPNRVEVRTEHPRGRRNYVGSVDYSVTVPTGVDATIKVVSGDVRVTNVKGELRAESISGNVTVNGAARLAFAKSVSGNVDVTDAAAESALAITAVSGSLTGRGLKARTLELSSVSGDVILTNVTCDRATVKTTSGNVEYDGPLARAGRYEMHAHSGNVRLAVTSTTGFELEATTFNGDVRSDFPLTLRAGIEGRGSRMGRFNRSIRGSYGDGSAIVMLKSFSGNIVVTKR